MDAYKGYQPAMEWDANAGECPATYGTPPTR